MKTCMSHRYNLIDTEGKTCRVIALQIIDGESATELDKERPRVQFVQANHLTNNILPQTKSCRV